MGVRGQGLPLYQVSDILWGEEVEVFREQTQSKEDKGGGVMVKGQPDERSGSVLVYPF